MKDSQLPSEENQINIKEIWLNGVSEEIQLSVSTIVELSGKLEYFLEKDGTYTINILEKNIRMPVCPKIYKMLSYVDKKEKVSLINLAGTKKAFHSERFQHIIKMLIEKNLLNKIA